MQMIDFQNPQVSVSRQCRLLNLSRSTLYYKPVAMAPQDLALMRWIDEQYLKTPCYGSRSMTRHLRRLGYRVNRKHIQRLMRLMGLEAIYP
jgi:putative transposase